MHLRSHLLVIGWGNYLVMQVYCLGEVSAPFPEPSDVEPDCPDGRPNGNTFVATALGYYRVIPTYWVNDARGSIDWDRNTTLER